MAEFPITERLPGVVEPPSTTPTVPSWHVGAATGIGSLPGDSPAEAGRLIAGELPELPFMAELPDRGVGADMLGRAVGMLVDIWGDVVPSGWRVSRRPTRDTRRARDFLEWDLDAVTEQYRGAAWMKLQVCGPWTLAAGIEVPSGNRALIDDGAVDDLAASMLEGLKQHLAELGRRLPGTRFVVQIDEPSVPAVLAGVLPTASGFGTVRATSPTRVGQVLQLLTDSLPDVPTVVHCCHRDAPWRLFRAAGFQALSVDFAGMGTAAAQLDPIGEAVEAGVVLLAGLLPGIEPTSARPTAPTTLYDWAAPLLGVWDRLGFPRHTLSGAVVPTPVCGLAAADAGWARTALKTCRELARAFEDPPQGW